MSRDAFRRFVAENYASLPPPPQPPPTGVPGPLPVPPFVGPIPTTPTGDTLPGFKWAHQIIPANIILPPLLIDGLLHQGCKLMFSAGSKSFKSWCSLDMGIAVADGTPWWGLKTHRGTVLYINFELIEGFFEERIISVCRARSTTLPNNFIYWNLRGYCYDLSILAKILRARIAQTGPIALVIVDPIYKALGDLDENSASDMTKLMNLIETITVEIGASVVFDAHFAKGNAAGKEAKDRASGSGVLSRDPDALLSLTKHKVEDAYVVESELRYLPRLSPFVIRWNFPLMQPDESLDPRQLYVPGEKDDTNSTTQGGPNSFNEMDVLACLPEGGAQDTLWRKMVSLKFTRSGPEFYAAKASLLNKGFVVKVGNKYYRANLHLSSQS